MSTKLYSPTASLRRKLQGALATLALGAALAPAAMAQIVVPAGNPNTSSARRPLGTYFGYERSAVIYTAAEIGTSGNLTSIGFYVNSVSTPGLAPTKVYLKTVTNNSFAAATTVATEETGATLVYDATIPASSFTANNWVTIPLTAPFAYNGTSNLEVIVETNATGAGNEDITSKQFRSNTGATGQAQYWNQDNTAPTGTGTLSATRPNIQLTGLTPIACPAPTNLAIAPLTTTTASLSFTAPTTSTSYTVTYYPTATPASSTTVTPAPTASPVTLTGLTGGTSYTVNVTSVCSGGAGTQVATLVFTMPTVLNDNPNGAITLPIATTCTPVNGTNTGATVTAPNGYVNPGLAGCGIAANPRDVWYKVTTAATGAASTAVRITVTGAPAGYLRLFSATSANGPFTELACAAGTTNNTVSAPLTAYNLTPNTTYYVSVSGYGSADTQGAFTICATSLPANDAAVQAIYTLGKTPAGAPVTVTAVIRNAGSSAITNVPVTMTVSGVNTVTNSQQIASIAPGATGTATFTVYTPATAGTNTITVTVLADEDLTNNSQVYTQVVTTNVFSYANAATPNPSNSVGFGATSTAAFAARFTTAVPRLLTAINAGLADPNTVGQTVYAAAYSETGALLARTPNYVVTAADINTRKGFTFATPVNLPAGNFLVALVQTPSTSSTQYFPMAYLPVTPTPTNTFFTLAATGGTPTDAASSNFGIFILEAVADVVTGTSAALNRAISLYPNPSTNGEVTLSVQGAKAQAGLEVQIINTLGQTVYTNAQLRDNFENKLNLSHLSAGVYTLKVKMGNEYTIRQLSLTK